MTRARRLAVLLAPILITLLAQAPPAFDVTSVKLSEPGSREIAMRPNPGGQSYLVRNVPVRFMIKRVYRLIDEQISGGPAWMNSERYDIDAKTGTPASVDQLQPMFQALLADRFHLQFHRETRQLPIFVLTVDKNGSRLKPNATADAFSGRIGPNIIDPLRRTLPGMTGVGVAMPDLCWNLSQMLGRQVVDRTGLTGYYDFRLEFVTDSPPRVATDGGDAPPSLEGPSIFSAVREQLGLKLETRKGPVDVLVVDRLEKPSAN